ncbi:hypothetical protein BJ878DRAFT_209238 [Calycina marina]|uniref:Uncharacterized protein n=1 Tax=Calycina marina TaxID=1763456 RepID=A0A9P7Z953_9HELO|nr:hypothetical protein BJ878DRAFT_209238 [Calycina marina]
MAAPKALPLVLGTLAILSTLAMVAFDIIFAISLTQPPSPHALRIIAIVAAGFGSATAALTLVLLGRQIRYRNENSLGGHGQHFTYLFAGSSGICGLLTSVASVLLLGLMSKNLQNLPQQIVGASAKHMIVSGFIVWAIAMLSQTVFVICIMLVPRRELQQQIRRYSAAEVRPTSGAEEKPIRQEDAYSPQELQRGSFSMEHKSPSTTGRSRSYSDTMTSIRSSVKTSNSRSKLISPKSKRTLSITSSHYEPSIIVEDSFDSWDYSAAESKTSPTAPGFLETIPASPTTSRSNSPGVPLDLEPPRPARSRSYSPSDGRSTRPYSPSNSLRRPRNISPTEPSKEAHIHPLFRSDSPTPAPAATPGTVVTAAPGAGQLISGSASLRSVRSQSRMRSPSIPTSPSPLGHSASMDSIRQKIVEEMEEGVETVSERTITPPIPAWIMEAGSRKSLGAYQIRKMQSVDEIR